MGVTTVTVHNFKCDMCRSEAQMIELDTVPRHWSKLHRHVGGQGAANDRTTYLCTRCTDEFDTWFLALKNKGVR